MGGGLMQLVATGAQDVFLTGNPEITFFKVVYRKHTNFSMESIEQTFNGGVDFGKKVTATISRNGDLITNVYLQAELPTLNESGVTYVNSIGHALMEYIELEIGGQRIDKHYSEWLEIWSELTLPAEKAVGYSHMVGKMQTENALMTGGMIYVPLMFFFNRNPGLALPLIALQYHEVKINIQFREFLKLVKGPDGTPVDKKDLKASLYVDYIYLDTDERRRFAQDAHDRLIDQLQFTGDESISAGQTNVKLRMNFNHPVKELIFVVQDEEASDDNDYFNFKGVDDGEPVKMAKLQLNGHDRFSERPGSYFRLVQPYQHHTRVPQKHIYVYSFAMKPEDHQPSGTCNFSRIDNATLHLTLADNIKASKVKIFAVNYNVLKIMSGMGGLAYSN